MKERMYIWIEFVDILFLFSEWISGLGMVRGHSSKEEKKRCSSEKQEYKHLIRWRDEEMIFLSYQEWLATPGSGFAAQETCSGLLHCVKIRRSNPVFISISCSRISVLYWSTLFSTNIKSKWTKRAPSLLMTAVRRRQYKKARVWSLGWPIAVKTLLTPDLFLPQPQASLGGETG